MAQVYRIKMTILKKPYERPVHFKIDGQRFDSDKTLKFNVNSKYVVNVCVKPPSNVEHVTMFGVKLDMDELKQPDEESSTFRGEMSTAGLTKNIKGSRQSFPLQIQLRGLGEMTTQLQCKFYGEHEIQHACWGTPLSHMEFEVRPSEGGRLDVITEAFR